MLMSTRKIILSAVLISSIISGLYFSPQSKAEHIWHRGMRIPVNNHNVANTAVASGSNAYSQPRSNYYPVVRTYYYAPPYNNEASSSTSTRTKSNANPYFDRSSANPYFKR